MLSQYVERLHLPKSDMFHWEFCNDNCTKKIRNPRTKTNVLRLIFIVRTYIIVRYFKDRRTWNIRNAMLLLLTGPFLHNNDQFNQLIVITQYSIRITIIIIMIIAISNTN